MAWVTQLAGTPTARNVVSTGGVKAVAGPANYLMETEHKTWLPMITIGLILGFMLGYVAEQAVPPSTASAADFENQTAELISEADYRSTVKEIISAYQTNQNAELAYKQLLELRVPAADTANHLSLVLTFGAIKDGEVGKASDLANILTSISWLNL